MAQWLDISRCMLREFKARSVQDYLKNIMFLPSQRRDIVVSLYSGVNEYLLGHRWQMLYDKLIAPHGCSAVCSPGNEMNEQVQ